MTRPLRWLTCAPRDYRGDATYFSRDTGLLCRGLQEAGAECRAILAGGARAGDAPDLIRASVAEMDDPRWWRGVEADAVAVHTWSRKEHTGILRAIRKAGLRVVLIQDGTGVTGPLGTWGDWVRESWYFRHRHGGGLQGAAWFAARMVHGHTLRLAGFERSRALQFELADLIVVPSPRALAGYRELADRLGGNLASKLRLLPYPVAPWFQRDAGIPKENLIVSVGRWSDYWQKRPDLLGASLAECLRNHPGWRARIFGEPGPELSNWHQGLDLPLRSRIELGGEVPNHKLAPAMRRAKISLCSSAYESFHIASGEALCSGCSVVGLDSAMTPSLGWFAGEQSGSLTNRLHAAGYADALAREISAWESAQRDPDTISRRWCNRLHAREVARSLIELTSS
jgi:hypothetical protein